MLGSRPRSAGSTLWGRASICVSTLAIGRHSEGQGPRLPLCSVGSQSPGLLKGLFRACNGLGQAPPPPLLHLTPVLSSRSHPVPGGWFSRVKSEGFDVGGLRSDLSSALWTLHMEGPCDLPSRSASPPLGGPEKRQFSSPRALSTGVLQSPRPEEAGGGQRASISWGAYLPPAQWYVARELGLWEVAG